MLCNCLQCLLGTVNLMLSDCRTAASKPWKYRFLQEVKPTKCSNLIEKRLIVTDNFFWHTAVLCCWLLPLCLRCCLRCVTILKGSCKSSLSFLSLTTIFWHIFSIYLQEKKSISGSRSRSDHTANAHSRRPHRTDVYFDNVNPRQCYGPGCIEAARYGSKYCSDECGLKLANKYAICHIFCS